MKKTAENRYPHSATLFRFCKEALEIRYDGNVKVIDQDVGSILGYDPADCSHWKKGKKNIHTLPTLKSIAKHLSLDERLLIDVASGKINLEEAIFEFGGYGKFALNTQNIEAIRKDFFRNPEKWEEHNKHGSFEDVFNLRRSAVVAAAEQILKSGNFKEAPVYIPEIYKLFPGIQLEKDEQQEGQSFRTTRQGEGPGLKITVFSGTAEMRPYTRFLLARQLFSFLIESRHEITHSFREQPREVREIQANIFAATLLIPAFLLKKEVEEASSSADIVRQLSETFWVSHTLMNQRLRDYMEHMN